MLKNLSDPPSALKILHRAKIVRQSLKSYLWAIRALPSLGYHVYVQYTGQNLDFIKYLEVSQKKCVGVLRASPDRTIRGAMKSMFSRNGYLHNVALEQDVSVTEASPFFCCDAN